MVASGVSLDRSYYQQQNKHNRVKKKKKTLVKFYMSTHQKKLSINITQCFR